MRERRGDTKPDLKKDEISSNLNLRVNHGIVSQGKGSCATSRKPKNVHVYVNGTLRSWLHYLDVRDDEGVTQWEHVLLAREIKKVMAPAFPIIMGDNKPQIRPMTDEERQKSNLSRL